MALSPDELILVRRAIGDEPPDEELHIIHDRVKSTEEVIREVLERRLANLLRSPASLSVPGEVAINNSANIKALQGQLDEIAAAGFGVEVRVVKPRYRYRR